MHAVCKLYVAKMHVMHKCITLVTTVPVCMIMDQVSIQCQIDLREPWRWPSHSTSASQRSVNHTNSFLMASE